MPHRTLVGADVLVDQTGVDVALVTRPGERNLLVLSPAMSFDAAVRGVIAVSPRTHAADAERLVRTYLPDAIQLDPDAMAVQPGGGLTAWAPEPAPESVWRPALSYSIVGVVGVLLIVAMAFSAHSIGAGVEQIRSAPLGAPEVVTGSTASPASVEQQRHPWHARKKARQAHDVASTQPVRSAGTVVDQRLTEPRGHKAIPHHATDQGHHTTVGPVSTSTTGESTPPPAPHGNGNGNGNGPKPSQSVLPPELQETLQALGVPAEELADTVGQMLNGPVAGLPVP
jgi:hypothetical protein